MANLLSENLTEPVNCLLMQEKLTDPVKKQVAAFGRWTTFAVNFSSSREGANVETTEFPIPFISVEDEHFMSLNMKFHANPPQRIFSNFFSAVDLFPIPKALRNIVLPDAACKDLFFLLQHFLVTEFLCFKRVHMNGPPMYPSFFRDFQI